MTVVKICGIMRPEDAIAAADAEADFVGIIFAPGRRRRSVDQGREIVQRLRAERPEIPAVVGVFADMAADEVNQIVQEVGIDRVQLSGSEPPEYRSLIKSPVIKAVKLTSGLSEDKIMEIMASAEEYLDPVMDICLVEPHVEGAFGGTGVKVAPEYLSIIRGFTFFLAGGLNPDNVGSVVREAEPWGVDVSSGVETDGEKDSLKIARFVYQAKRVGGWRL